MNDLAAMVMTESLIPVKSKPGKPILVCDDNSANQSGLYVF